MKFMVEHDVLSDHKGPCRTSEHLIAMEQGWQMVREELSSGSMYWYGYDDELRPILWVRPFLKKWRGMNRRREILAHVLLIEWGLRELLPPPQPGSAHKAVDQFVLVVDADKLGLSQFDPALMKQVGACSSHAHSVSLFPRPLPMPPCASSLCSISRSLANPPPPKQTTFVRSIYSISSC
jgi:hypothetical protein